MLSKALCPAGSPKSNNAVTITSVYVVPFVWAVVILFLEASKFNDAGVTFKLKLSDVIQITSVPNTLSKLLWLNHLVY